MTNTEMMGLRAALEAKRLEIAAQTRGRVKELIIEDSQPELVDWIQRMSDRDESAGMLNRFSSTLADVERALRAIAQNRYGTCLHCEQQIPIKRLRSIPWAAYCIRCQEMIEKGCEDPYGWNLDKPQAA